MRTGNGDKSVLEI